ncbi:MAG: hypothetical protein ACI9DK_000100 [Vicingaceae bacterium]|jgi:hypothetical protein
MKIWVYLFLLIATLIVFGNTLSNGYNLDDHLVTKNHLHTNPKTKSNLITIFSSAYQNDGGLKSGFRPVAVASFYLEHQLFGESAKVSHAINLLLFLGIVLLLYQFLTLLFRDVNEYILVFVALLFCVHSIHSEVVASIKNRDELLCLLFFVLAAISSIGWVNRKNVIYLIFTLFFISFSLLSKKSTLPVIALFPVLLLYTHKIKFSQFTALGLITSISIGVFAFNFQVIPGLAIFAALNLCYLVAFYLPKYWKSKSLLTPSVLEIIILFLVFSFTLSGAYFEQLILLIAAQLILIGLVKNRFNVAVLLSVLISIISYLLFYKSEALVYLIILASAGALVNRQAFKFNPKFLIGIIPLLLLIGFNGRSEEMLVYLSPLFVFATVLIHRIIPLILSIIMLAVSLCFGVLGYFQVGIFLFAVLASFKIEMIKSKKIYFATWLFSTVLYMGITHENQENTFYFNTNVAQNTIRVDKQQLREGRKLEFVENTLVAKHTLEERFATGLLTMGTYLGLMVYPKELSFYYGYSKINTTDFKDYKVWISLSSYLLLLFCIAYFYNKQPLIAIGSAWFIACILLFSNLPILVAGMVGERLAFTASMGFCIFVGGLLNWLKPNFNLKKLRAIELIVLGLLVVLGSRTVARNSKWESHVKLMSNDIHHLENSAQANYLLAVHSIKEAEQSAKGGSVDIQKVSASIGYFKRAIEIYPNYYNFHIDLGKAYLVMLQPELAKASFLVADQLDPNALLGLFELAKVSFTLKEYEEVIKHSEGYLKRSKSNPTIYELAAFSAYYVDDYSLALRYTKEGLNLFPANQSFAQLLPDLERRIIEYNSDR